MTPVSLNICLDSVLKMKMSYTLDQRLLTQAKKVQSYSFTFFVTLFYSASAFKSKSMVLSLTLKMYT